MLQQLVLSRSKGQVPPGVSNGSDTEPGSKFYLVGGSDESEDVHLGVRLHIITKQGVEVRNGRQGAVFIGHTVQVPGRRNESGG